MGKNIIDFLNEILSVYLEMAPYLLIGLTFAGLLHAVFSKDFIAKHLGGNNLVSVIKAAIFGVPLPLCSCGVVPTALSLRKNSASEGATVSFLISTPQTGVDSIIATYGMMGPFFAVYRPLASFIMGIIGGVVTNLLPTVNKNIKDNIVEEHNANSCSDGCELSQKVKMGFYEKIKDAISYGYLDMLNDISLQIIVGIILSASISYFLPDDFFGKYAGNSFLEMLIMIIGGIPLYICATGSIPIAVALMGKGISAGAAFVFLAVGPATNAATITLIGNAMGKRIAILYVSVIAITAIVAGVILNIIVSGNGDVLIPMATMQRHDMSNDFSLLSMLSSALFSLLLINSLLHKYFPYIFEKQKKTVDIAQNQTVLSVNGMTCGNCAKHVEESVLRVFGVKTVTVELNVKRVTVVGDCDLSKVKLAITSAGYSVV